MPFVPKSEYLFPISMLATLGVFQIPSLALAQGDTWTYQTPMPTGRGFTSGTVVDGKAYVIGGFLTHYSVTDANEVYDPSTDLWATKAPMLEGRCAHASCALNGKIYVFGGLHPDPYAYAKNNVYEYDPQTDTWIQKANMPYDNAFCGIAALNDTIYLIGGTTNFYVPPISTVMAYEPVTESWAEKAPLSSPRAFMSACTWDGKIYIFGGGDENLLTSSYDDVKIYDPVTNSWEEGTDMPTSRFGLGACALNDKIYAVGGVTDGLVVLTTNEMYDPVTDTWTTKSPMHETRQTFCLGRVGDKMYAIGGSYPDPQDPSEPVVLSSVEEYDPELTGAEEAVGTGALPSGYALHQCYPNPFSASTTIGFSSPNHSFVTLRMYDVSGQEVETLVIGERPAGDFEVEWAAKALPSGVYLYRLQAAGFNQARTLILQK